jgi:lysine biosynthesis protein LysW
MSMVMGACPECDADVPLADPALGHRFQCPCCRAELLVIGLTPIELDWAFVEPIRIPSQENKEIGFDQKWQNEV